jgi:hypothetical protein
MAQQMQLKKQSHPSTRRLAERQEQDAETEQTLKNARYAVQRAWMTITQAEAFLAYTEEI